MQFCQPGWRQKLNYVRFGLWVLLWALLWRPQWIYASDPLSCPVALSLSFLCGLKIIYHEHDSPDVRLELLRSKFQKLVLGSRSNLAKRANLCVVPNERRAERFRLETRTNRPVLCVWNCPAFDEVQNSRACGDRFVVFFHGSIVPARLPLTVLDALAKVPDRIILRIAGYETVGHMGYIHALQKRAVELDLKDRFEFLGVFSRYSLLEECRNANVGIAILPLHPEDFNHEASTGASNKPFDYLACGLALLVADLPDWRKMFVHAGYGLSCDPDDPESIARALQWFIDHPSETRAMGTRGREQIVADWNYERQFASVLGYLAR